MRRSVAVFACLLGLLAANLQPTALSQPARGEARIARPHITRKWIPFGAKRRRETAAYSRRHYGRRTYELSHPQVIVEHYTDGTTFASAWNTFASDARH